MITDQEKSTSEKQRLAVLKRSWGRCEAELTVNGAWTRCFAKPVDVHHMLTRSRGGDLLDEVGEDYHLGALCTYTHHPAAHGAGGRDLMIEGYVTRDSSSGRVYYTGPDQYLTEKYPDPRSHQ